MISAKKLIKLARKWQKLAAIKRKRITTSGTNSCGTSATVEKGNFAVYSADEKRFVLPLEYLKNEIVRELFVMAEEEFGLSSSSPLTLPCDAEFMEYVIDLIKTRPTKDVEKALLTSISGGRCSSSSFSSVQLQQQSTREQFLVRSC